MHPYRPLALACLLVLASTADALAQGRFVEGPYVDRLTADTATLHLRTASPTRVRVTFAGASGPATRESSMGTMHRIVLSGFEAGTRVTYEASAEGIQVVTGSFLASRPNADAPVDFVVIGDTRDGDVEHARIVRSVVGDPGFVIHMGDYVPTGGSDDQWPRYFDAAAPLLRRAALVPTLGNHELIAPGGLERFLARFAIAGPTGATYQTFDFDGVRILVLDSNSPIDRGTEQYRFAERELERAGADPSLRALFVAIHHGPFSSGRHGEFEPLHTSGLVDAMRRARVDLILSGHDHIYERGDAEGLKYVVSGGGGSPLYRANDRRPYQLAFAASYHHLRVRVDAQGIAFDAVRADGTVLERCSFRRGASYRCDRSTRPPREEGVSPTEDILEQYGVRIAAVALIGIVAFLVLLRRARRVSR